MTESNEEVVQFGQGGHLTGVLLLPTDTKVGAAACLLLNVGVTHRIGPRRLNVKLARAFADQGVPSLRFDLSGIGDSVAASGRSNFREQTMLDMKAAMDHIQARTGICRFTVIGICSGAVNGYWSALSDPRVVGLSMFDGFTYATSKTQLIHDWRRLCTTPWRTVIDKAVRRVKRLFGQGTPAPVSIFSSAPESVRPTREEFRRAMDTLIARGVSVQVLYSGSLLVQHNYEAQLRDAFPRASFLDHVDYHYLPDVDHLATPLVAQRKLIGVICAWLRWMDASAGQSEWVLPAAAVEPIDRPLRVQVPTN